MNHLAGKKVLCFIALPHHNRFLVPIMEALAARGMEVGYFTAAAEGAFEITLNQAGLSYRHVLDYADDETSQRVRGAMAELRLTLQPKILANPIMQSVPLVIQDKTLRTAMESFHALDRMVEVEKPDLLFALHELNPWGKILGYLSHRYRIPYFTLQEGLYYGDIHYYRFHTDYSTACLVWGEECRQILRRAGCADDKIFAVGNTHIWTAAKHYCADATVAATRQALGIGADKKIILFLMSHSSYNPFEAGKFLRWMKERGDIVALFKWHPATGKDIIERATEKLRGQPGMMSMCDVDTYAAIGASTVCVTVGNSTTGLEALAFGKPLLEVRLPDQLYSYGAIGVAEPVLGFEDMSDKIAALLDAGVAPATAANVERYLASNFAHRDDRTLQRIVDLSEQAVAARREGATAPLSSPAAVRAAVSIILPVEDGSLEPLVRSLEAIAAHSPPDLFEVVLVNCAADGDTRALLASLAGDVTMVDGQRDWNYSEACNQAVRAAAGKYLVFLKPGLLPEPRWLEGLLEAAEAAPEIGAVAGQVLNANGLLWQVGVAFDVNHSPFALYRLLPREFPGANRQREFEAVEFPLLVRRDRFCQLGGFNADLSNRFEDVDLCLTLRRAGLSVIYTPACVMTRAAASWQPAAATVMLNRIRFYGKWTGWLWQNDGRYLKEDGLTHDSLSALYREFAGRIATGAAAITSECLAPAP